MRTLQLVDLMTENQETLSPLICDCCTKLASTVLQTQCVSTGALYLENRMTSSRHFFLLSMIAVKILQSMQTCL